MTKPRIAIVGAGLCGSVLAARLRNGFDVTVIEQASRYSPLLADIHCDEGGVTSTINRGQGLGGTTSYWHNALVELETDELRACGIDPAEFAAYYRRAWALFLSDAQFARCQEIRKNCAALVPDRSTAHMVAPQARDNVWDLAQRTWPGDPINVMYGHARRVECDDRGRGRHLVVDTQNGPLKLDADHFVFSAGGLATPTLLAASFHGGESFCGGYHDHPMAYVGKIRVRPDSVIKRISCVETGPASVRTGMVYESDGLKAVFYLRPALSLDIASIMGDARYILSDLRNDPFSPRKIWQLLRNVEALREAVLFKARAGFVGDYYSLLMFGEQQPLPSRGVAVRPGQLPVLNWHVTDREHAAYQDCFQQFLAGLGGELVDHRAIPGPEVQYRTGAHHSGTASHFMRAEAGGGAEFFAVGDSPNVSACDGSVLRCGGVANSGLTLVALSHQLADALIAR